MNKKLKQKWVKNLRSGRFSQTYEYLRGGEDGEQNSFCCLGVLCETAIESFDGKVGPFKVKRTVLGYEFCSDTNKGKRLVEEVSRFVDKYGDPEGANVQFIDSFEDDFGEDILLETQQTLPAPLVVHLGMDKVVTDKGEKKNINDKLMNMNDRSDSFEKIANYIERVEF